MNIKRLVFEKMSDAVIAASGLNRPIRLYRAFLDRVDSVKHVNLRGTPMVFDANDELHLLRAEWAESKEPETIDWIDSFERGAVFFDIGANVGVYALYAALHRDCDVHAFEPEAKNYACLNRNILLNSLGRRVKAFNIALHESTHIDFLQLHDLSSGAALHTVGEPVDWRGRPFQPKFEQAVLAFSLDEFIERFGVAVPTHIKLDVDGNEEKIIRGGLRTFTDRRMQSLMIEISENNRTLIELIQSCGLKVAVKTLARMQGQHQDVYNTVFTRAG